MAYFTKNFYNDKGLIKIENNGKSLFQALEMSRIYQTVEKSAGMTKFSWARLEKNIKRQKEFAELLFNEINVIYENKEYYGLNEIELVQQYYDSKYPEMYRIVAFCESSGLRPIYKGEYVKKFIVPIIRNGNQWHGIKTINKYFSLGRSIFCVDCEITYRHKEKHTTKCTVRCRKCCRVGYGFPCENKDPKITCNKCNRDFFNYECFDFHKKSACNLYKKCKKCNREYQHNKNKPHRCGEKFCKICFDTHCCDESCFIKPIKVPNELPEYRIIVFDIECITGNKLNDGKYEGKLLHKPNYLSARFTCTLCEEKIQDCRICGPKTLERHKKWCSKGGKDVTKNFIKWLLKFRDYDTYVYAHFSGRYDGHFILRELTDQGFPPELIMAELKIIEMRVKNFKMIYFRDSWLLIQGKLADLPKTFNLKTPAKLFFPYEFNSEKNYGIKLSTLPPIDDYNPDKMKEEEYNKFVKWYYENYNSEFLLEKELEIYCGNDTKILMETIIKLRRIFIELTKDKNTPQGYDVMKSSLTIASASMNIYRAKFLKSNHLPIVPEKGFEKTETQSLIAVKYFEWIMERDNVKGRHANNGGEYNFYGYKVDFFCGKQKRIIEFQGCNFHGCKKCFRPNEFQANNKTAKENYAKTQARMTNLNILCKRYGYTLEEVWECDVIKELKKNKKMSEFFNELPDKGNINPRLAFHGGRTGPLCLFAEASDEYELGMADIVSLYPFVNYSAAYPVGTPLIKKPKPKERIVNWTEPDDIPYDGLLTVRVLPPKDLLIPLLPYHYDDMLLFPLCGKCARMSKPGFIKTEHFKPCKHNEKERALTGTYTSIELKKSLELGYKIDRFYRAYHYEKFDSDLFKEYIKKFLKIKIEASGYPSDVKTDAEKEKFRNLYEKKYGIILDDKNMIYNPGMRHIAKLALNALWGKFSMRNKLNKTKIVNNAEDYFEMVLNDKIEMGRPVLLGSDMLRLIWKDKDEHIVEHKTSNVIISIWTTSQARLELYKYMEQIYKADNCKLIYTDTDSVIYSFPRGNDPLKTGQFLGDMSKEYTDSEILEVICAGPKQYALKLKRKSDDKIWNVTKIRGMTMNRKNKIDYEEFKKLVLHYKEGEKIIFANDQFGPTRESLVISRKINKEYKPVQKKGIIDEELNVLPFGFY